MKTKIEAPEVAVDPTLDAQKQAADASLITNLQTQAAGDTASIMTRYGVNIALGHAGMSTGGVQDSISAPDFAALGRRIGTPGKFSDG